MLRAFKNGALNLGMLAILLLGFAALSAYFSLTRKQRRE